MNWLDLPAYFDPIDRIEGVISTFRYADWEGAYQRDASTGSSRNFLLASHRPTPLPFTLRAAHRGAASKSNDCWDDMESAFGIVASLAMI
jgi:hypothetical protein